MDMFHYIYDAEGIGGGSMDQDQPGKVANPACGQLNGR